MHGPEILIPLTMFGGAFLLVFGIRYLENKENMAMIERGLNPRNKRRSADPSRTLKNALMFIGAGLGLMLAILISRNMHDWLSEGEQTGLYFALIAIFGGLGMLGAYLYERKNPPPTPEEM